MRRIILTAILFTIISVSADAYARGNPASKMLREMDVNNDQKISQGEFENRREKKFSRMDKDSDGCISKDEFVGDASPKFKRYDRNSDGYISHEDFIK